MRGSAEKHRAHWNPTWPGGITVVVVVGRVKLGQLCYHSRSYRSGFGTCLRLRGFHAPLSLKPRTLLVPNTLYDWPLSNNRSVGSLSHRLRWLRSRWSSNPGCRSIRVSSGLVRPSSISQRPGRGPTVLSLHIETDCLQTQEAQGFQARRQYGRNIPYERRLL